MLKLISTVDQSLATKIDRIFEGNPEARCAISHLPMLDPVQLGDCRGHVFEFDSIARWLEIRPTNPLNGVLITSKTVQLIRWPDLKEKINVEKAAALDLAKVLMDNKRWKDARAYLERICPGLDAKTGTQKESEWDLFSFASDDHEFMYEIFDYKITCAKQLRCFDEANEITRQSALFGFTKLMERMAHNRLMEAIEKRNLAEFRGAVDDLGLNYRVNRTHGILAVVVQLKWVEGARELVKRGADPTVNDIGFGYSPTELATISGRQDLLGPLSEGRVNIFGINPKTHSSLLHLAASMDQIDSVIELLRLGADPMQLSNVDSHQYSFGRLLLMYGRPENIQKLVNYLRDTRQLNLLNAILMTEETWDDVKNPLLLNLFFIRDHWPSIKANVSIILAAVDHRPGKKEWQTPLIAAAVILSYSRDQDPDNADKLNVLRQYSGHTFGTSETILFAVVLFLVMLQIWALIPSTPALTADQEGRHSILQTFHRLLARILNLNPDAANEPD